MRKHNLILSIVTFLMVTLIVESCSSKKEDSYLEIICEVPIAEIIKTTSSFSEDSIFNAALHKSKQLQNNSQEDLVALFGKAFEELDPNARLAAYFFTVDLRGRISFNSTNAEVLQIIDSLVSCEIENAYNVIWNRINNYGFKRPKVKKLDAKGRFQIKLPGIKKSKDVLQLFQSSGLLEFWETLENSEVYPYLLDANNLLIDIEGKSNNSADDSAENSSKPSKEINSIFDELEATESSNSNYDKKQFSKKYPLFAILKPNTSTEGNLLTGPVVGLAHINDTAKINNILALEQVNNSFPRNLKFCWSAKSVNDNFLQLIALKISTRDGKAPLNGKVITNAKQEIDEYTDEPIVNFSMNAEGAKLWSRLTGENIGKSIAMVINNHVLSFPTVQNKIYNGQSSISSPMSLAEAQDLANILKSGSIYVPLRIIDIKVVENNTK